jgi:hypothetical protein
VNCRTMLIGEEIESGAHHFVLQAQHSESDLKNVGNLCGMNPRVVAPHLACDLFQHIDFLGSRKRKVNQHWRVFHY